jgi:Protein of unknown function (DUF3237)
MDGIPIRLSELMVIEINVRPVVEVEIDRRYVLFDDGFFAGPDGLRGTLLPGGIDWQRIRADGTIEIDAHYVLRTDDDDLIEVRSKGLRRVPDAVAARIAAGERVGADDYYFRTHVTLATSSIRWERLNGIIAISTGVRELDTVRIHVQEVL